MTCHLSGVSIFCFLRFYEATRPAFLLHPFVAFFCELSVILCCEALLQLGSIASSIAISIAICEALLLLQMTRTVLDCEIPCLELMERFTVQSDGLHKEVVFETLFPACRPLLSLLEPAGRGGQTSLTVRPEGVVVGRGRLGWTAPCSAPVRPARGSGGGPWQTRMDRAV